MREIKFRAWDKINETMYENIHMHDRCNEYLCRPSEYDIMQYTGINDKNNKEIYEGDIVENNAIYDEVIFNKGVFTGKKSAVDRFGVQQSLAVHRELEVIKTIYSEIGIK